MRILSPDLRDEAELERFYRVWWAAEEHGRTDAPQMSKQELQSYFTSQIDTEVFEPYAGYIAEELVAVGFTVYSKLDNLEKAEVYVAVDPAHRQRGYGSELIETLVEKMRALGRTTILSDSWIPEGERDTHPHRAFATKHGFALANIEIRRLLTIPVPAEQIEAWADHAAARHGDYELRIFDGPVDEELIPSLVDAMNQLGLEAPTGDIDFEARGVTPEIYLAREARNKESGKHLIRTLAVADDGTVAGYTVLAVPLLERDIVYQYGTLVRRDHRGHRLGLGMKAANLRVLQAKHPDRRYIDTCNAETNGPMVAINEQLGFRPVEVMAHYQRILPTTSKGDPAA